VRTLEVKTDQVFLTAPAGSGDFEFNQAVADVFDDMLVRSIPMYREQQRMVHELATKSWIPGTNIYDLGCSTATTLLDLAPVVGGSGQLVGFDNSLPMLERAQTKVRDRGLSEHIQLEYADLNAPLEPTRFRKASVIILCWTLQFIRPINRSGLIRTIYRALVDGGVLIVTEKIVSGHTKTNALFRGLYYDFKKRNHYSAQEIQRKREALENVLIPYRADENLELFRANGFERSEPFFQWYNFAGYLCLKCPSSEQRLNAVR
jgi:tRNA (cmo5U34)-methyltransferase